MWAKESNIVLLLFSAHWSIYRGTYWGQSGPDLRFPECSVRYRTRLTVQKDLYTVRYSILIMTEYSDSAFCWIWNKLLGGFSLKILMWSHCWVYLVIYIVVVTLIDTSWLILLLCYIVGLNLSWTKLCCYCWVTFRPPRQWLSGWSDLKLALAIYIKKMC